MTRDSFHESGTIEFCKEKLNNVNNDGIITFFNLPLLPLALLVIDFKLAKLLIIILLIIYR
jgi:hypothetical protein